MDPKRRRKVILLIVLLMMTANYSRITRNENVRMVEFLTIFAMGAVTSLLVREFAESRKNKDQ